MTKKRGFSLVEILIALALIGIVSVVSIRILSNRDNTLEYTAKRDKVLANMQGLAKEAMYNNLADEITYAELSNALAGLNTDGAGTRDKSSFTIGAASVGDYIASVEIDVNGADKFPNEKGRDKFLYYVDRYGNFVRDEIQAGNLMLAGGTSHWDKEQSVKLDKKDISGDKGTTPGNIDGPQDEGVYKDCPDGSKVLATEDCPAAPGKQWCNGVEISALEPCEQNAEVQCWDGSFVADLSQCPSKVTCPDGTFAKNMSECKVQCPDGSWAVTYSQCPPGGGGDPKPPVKIPDPTPDTKTKTCWDGSVIAAHLPCPAYQDCWDGSRIYKVQNCPTPKYCWDGSVIYEWEDCPPEPIECWDGTIVNAGESCPPETKTCWDGSVVGVDEDCPEKPCEVQTCASGYAWDASLCKCVQGGGGGDDCKVINCANELQTFNIDKCKCETTMKKCWDDTIIAIDQHCPSEDPDKYKCWDGTLVDNADQCPPCPAGTTFDGSTCIPLCEEQTCPNGYEWSQDDCKCVWKPCEENCGIGETWDAENCVCKKAENTDCPEGHYYDSATKMCKQLPCCDSSNPGHQSGAIACRPCSGGGEFCDVQICNEDQVWDEGSCSCVAKCDGPVMANGECEAPDKPDKPDIITPNLPTLGGGLPYCCNCSRPWIAGYSCMDGNSATQDCNAACGGGRAGGGGGGGGDAIAPEADLANPGGTTVGFDENGNPFTLHEGGKHGSYMGQMW